MRQDLNEECGPKESAMATQDHYSLRWNNHQNHILRAFDTLLQTKTLVDVTLVCAETSIRAHKMVLSACSPFFQRVFSETPCKHPVIVLKDFRGWVVQAIVDFMYRGEISVPQERLQTLIQAGESLQVRGLVENTVPGNTPTPAASPDDFSLMDASMLQSELGERCSSYDDEPAPTMISNSKLILPSQIFGDNAQSTHISTPDICTSPMPRRKQARPRRRSGECGPHDLSKPASPSPEINEVVKAETSKDEEKPKQPEDKQAQATEDEEEKEESPEKIRRSEQVEPENCDGPEDLCTKKDIDTNNFQPSKTHQQQQPPQPQQQQTQLRDQSHGLPQMQLDELNHSSNNNNVNHHNNNNNNNSCGSNNNINNNRIILSLKEFRHLNKPPSITRSPNPFHHSHPLNLRPSDSHGLKNELLESQVDPDSPFHLEQMDLSMAAAAAAAAQHQHQMVASGMLAMNSSNPHQQGHDRMDADLMNHRMNKDYTASSPMNLPSHFSQPDGPPHPPSPLPFPGMSSALGLTPPHMFGLDSPLGLFPPGMDPGKLYNPLMEMSDPRGLPGDHPPFLKKKMSRPKGQHSAPRGGPPRSWTNAELTEALQHVWNKKMTTSQASRIFGIPYNSLLMYVRGKYGKSLKLEQLRKDCISGPPLELLTMSMGGNNNNNNKSMNENRTKDSKDMEGPMQRSSSSEPDLMSSPNPIFNPFPPGFYPDFPGGFPGLPLGMLNLLPPERHQSAMHMNVVDEDCKSDRSKQSLEDDFPQPLALNREDRRELLQQNGQD